MSRFTCTWCHVDDTRGIHEEKCPSRRLAEVEANLRDHPFLIEGEASLSTSALLDLMHNLNTVMQVMRDTHIGDHDGRVRLHQRTEKR